MQDAYEHFQGAEDTADQIAKVYLKSSRYLSLAADEIFGKFQSKHRLSENEARRLINTLQDKTSLDELLQKLKSSESSKEKQDLIIHLEAPAYQARLERMRQIQNQLDIIMRDVYQQEKDFSTNFYTDLANDSYYRGIFNIQQRAGAAFSFCQVSAKVIEQVINSRWSGKNYSERIWGNTRSLAQDLKEELLINLITGRTNREAAEIIANKFAQGASNARRLVRTEAAYVSAELNFRAYEECKVENYRYLATLDLRTSEVCRKLDGMTFAVADRKVGQNCPPMHPWCRSTTIADVGEELLKKWQRSAVDPATGKRLKVPATMTYNEWYKKYVEGNPKAEAEQKRTQNRSADKEQYEKYREILGDDIPKSFAEFQEMKYNNIEQWEGLKAKKQSVLNEKDFSELGNLTGKLGNKETRLWYKAHDERIPNMLDKNRTLKEQAVQASKLRNQYRTQARELMEDQEARAELDKSHRNPTFEELVEHKMKKYGLTRTEAYQDIIRSSTTTNKKYDRIAGIEGKEKP